ncbi:hypothetical protein HMP0015_2377 [Acinetobacter haemolyticus ATCC 19194]|uniref:Uncharacterized protein n=1 Tax=Acinetobacter haemolyticus ATCC 19194 TaxID=707232 RepID=D4XRN5_ACIHA|nr:hypothetical protein HMP0015_2377 [Acinetobacter haemolyticus ATCC 19194]
MKVECHSQTKGFYLEHDLYSLHSLIYQHIHYFEVDPKAQAQL